MTPSESMTPARLCEAKRTKHGGVPCRRPAGWGTDHVGFGSCKLHGGAAPGPTKHALKERALWEQRLADQIDPAIGVLIGVMLDRDAADKDRIAAARDLLDRAGVKAPTDGLTLVVPVIRWPD